MSDPVTELLKNHEHRLDVQQMISTVLFGLLLSQLEEIKPNLKEDLHQILDNTQAEATGNAIANDAIDAIRMMLG